jgi:hypothetical protein
VAVRETLVGEKITGNGDVDSVATFVHSTKPSGLIRLWRPDQTGAPAGAFSMPSMGLHRIADSTSDNSA